MSAARRLPAAMVMTLAMQACGAAAPSCEDAEPGSQSPDTNADPALAATVPDEVGGEPFNVQTFCAAAIGALGLQTSDAFLAEVGVSLSDVTHARSPSPSIGDTDRHVELAAYRYRGADEDRIRDAFLEALDDEGFIVEPAVVGGRDTHRGQGFTIYVTGDTLYTVAGDEEKTVEILRALP